jgi:uncharacterized protein
MTHRPWEMPSSPYAMYMEWHNLLFAHWAVKPALLEPLIPKGLTLETFDGFAWLGVVPFQMRYTAPRKWLSVPWVSHFDELNLRTYVTDGHKRGVWFFSLDCNNPLAVRAARFGFHLPYMDATMQVSSRGDTVGYKSVRTHNGEPSAVLEASYRPTGDVFRSVAGSFEDWLTERYCLYSANRAGQVFCGEIDHLPWSLQPAEAEISSNSMAQSLGVSFAAAPEILHFSKEIRVKAWLLEKLK